MKVDTRQSLVENFARINQMVDRETILQANHKSISCWFTNSLPLSIIKAGIRKGVHDESRSKSNCGEWITKKL